MSLIKSRTVIHDDVTVTSGVKPMSLPTIRAVADSCTHELTGGVFWSQLQLLNCKGEVRVSSNEVFNSDCAHCQLHKCPICEQTRATGQLGAKWQKQQPDLSLSTSPPPPVYRDKFDSIFREGTCATAASILSQLSSKEAETNGNACGCRSRRHSLRWDIAQS
jgi:hypothetical protein